MRDKIYLLAFLCGAGILLYLGRDLLVRSTFVSWGLSFAGTTAAGVLGLALYRVQQDLRASRHELARKEAELNFAREVQRSLFPHCLPADHGLEFAGLCVPASGIGGDYYDVVEIDEGRLAFALADISGKGISAAILMSNLHAVLRTVANAGRTPAEVCDQLNHHLYTITQASRYATMFYGEWCAKEKRLTYSNAGHYAPVLVGSQRSEQLNHGGPPLGLFLESRFEEARISLEPGDVVALYSDGITDAEDSSGEAFGESRLRTVIAAHAAEPLSRIQQQVFEAVRAWSSEEATDDATLLLARVTAPRKEGA